MVCKGKYSTSSIQGRSIQLRLNQAVRVVKHVDTNKVYITKNQPRTWLQLINTFN